MLVVVIVVSRPAGLLACCEKLKNEFDSWSFIISLLFNTSHVVVFNGFTIDSC